MLKNYLTIAIRNLFRNKAFSIINISGLVLGITCSLLILLWVWDEQSIDGFHANRARLYTIYETWHSGNDGETLYGMPGLVADELKRKNPEIQYASSLMMAGEDPYFKVSENNIKVPGGFASADFFKMFSYKLVKGNPQNALSDYYDLAISNKMAKMFFGSSDSAFGKPIKLQRSMGRTANFKISAVFEDLPENSHHRFDFLINWKFALDSLPWLNGFLWHNPDVYIMLRPDANPEALQAKIKNFLNLYNKTGEGKGFSFEMGMIRFDKMYLHDRFENGKPSGGRIEYVNIFTIVAIFILLIACINFMNLTTARSVRRAKEVGIRKTVGALRSKLIIQFLTESILLCCLSSIISLFVVQLALPAFNELTGKHLVLPVNQIYFWWKIIGMILITGLISGSYPALFLSSLNTIKVLKGTLKFSLSAIWFRKGLVVFQFAISLVLIIGAMIIARQIKYVQTKNLGFNRENLLSVPLEQGLENKYDSYKQELSHQPGIKSVTLCTSMISKIEDGFTIDIDWPGKNPTWRIDANIAGVGYDFIKTTGMTIIEGRDFSRDFPSDSTGFIINDKALSMLGFKDPIGRQLTMNGTKGKIIGLIKDFNFSSLHNSIRPLILYFSKDANEREVALIRTEPGQTTNAIASIKKVCKDLNPDYPAVYKFADEEYSRLYQSEQFVGKLSDGFAILAILISCLGLLGLAMFTVQQRTKEIGIRKVLGASAGTIVVMLSTDILRLVIVSAVLASPLAYFVINRWLQHFAYRVNINAWLFVGAGFLALLIALSTISFQAIKAAAANPIKSLKTE
jgi:putative ABC transport system permease protein